MRPKTSNSRNLSTHSTWLSVTRAAPHFKFTWVLVILYYAGAGVTFSYVTTSKPHTDSEICECPCIGAVLNISEEAPSSVEEANVKAEELEKELTVEKSTTSSKTRTKVSVQDKRPSAKYVGSVAIVFISLVLGSIVFLDLISCGKGIKKTPSKKTKNRRPNKKTSEEEGDTALAGDQLDVDDKSFEDLSKADPSTGSTSDSEFYTNRYLNVPYSSAPLLVNRAAALNNRPGTKDAQLKDQLGDEDMSHFDVGLETIRIRALVPPYERTSEA